MRTADFEQAHAEWIQAHLARRTGERRGRLERGHGHAEKLFARNVWWPLQGHFGELHPEFEVPDWRGRSYFADFAWLPGNMRLIIEIKGFKAHVAEMDRQKFSNELNRETFLHGMGYEVVSFAYDDVEQRPEMCAILLRMLLGRYRSELAPLEEAAPAEREIVRLAIRNVQPIRPIDVATHLRVDAKTAVRMLRALVAKGWLRPHMRGSGRRIVRYELVRQALDYFR